MDIHCSILIGKLVKDDYGEMNMEDTINVYPNEIENTLKAYEGVKVKITIEEIPE